MLRGATVRKELIASLKALWCKGLAQGLSCLVEPSVPVIRLPSALKTD